MMKLEEKKSYAVWVYGKGGTQGFYCVVGRVLAEMQPAIEAFNAGPGKALGVEVQEPMPWGKARAHTWQAIKDKGFHREGQPYEHLAPDGVDITDAEVMNWWVAASRHGSHVARHGTELIDEIRRLAFYLERSLPEGHAWVEGPAYETDVGGGEYVHRRDTARCTGCSTVAFWCKVDETWKVDKNRDVTRSVEATCAEERIQIVEDAKSRIAISEYDEASKG